MMCSEKKKWGKGLLMQFQFAGCQSNSVAAKRGVAGSCANKKEVKTSFARGREGEVKGGKSNQKKRPGTTIGTHDATQRPCQKVGWVEVSLAQTVTVQTRQSTDHQLSIVHGDLEYISTSSCTCSTYRVCLSTLLTPHRVRE